MGDPIPFRPSGSAPGRPGGWQIAIPKRWFQRARQAGLAFLALAIIVSFIRSGDGRQVAGPRAPVAVLPLQSGEAAVVIKARDLDLRLGDNVRIVVTPRNGQGIAHLVPGRVLSYDGSKAIVAVTQEEANRYASDFSDGLGIIAAPGEGQ